jgi:hypothetical protein
MTWSATRTLSLQFWLLSGALLAGAEIDEKLLPAPAPKILDFPHDVKPILENNCLRCHGPERPKSGFRLTDRVSALKGGANGIDIIPGESAKSPLIHYVTRLVPEMEMPPEGKGTPLSSNEVSMLRAWIDQGLLWNDGLENFALTEKWPDGRAVSAEGHLLRDDHKLTLDLRKPDLGFTLFGFERYRKYYDEAGGYYGPFSPPLYFLSEQPQHLQVSRGRRTTTSCAALFFTIMLVGRIPRQFVFG